VVSNRAPIEVSRGDDGAAQIRRTVGGLATALDEALRERPGRWIAWVGDVPDAELAPAASGLPYPLHPVSLTQGQLDNYYSGFANQVLWPLCHMFPTRCIFDAGYWSDYRSANARFAEKVAEVARPGDLVWVNDFHLSLVPELLRAARVPARVGLFWHIPFPPPAMFGICRWREELLSGLLGADVLGFQTPEDAENFVACAARFLRLRSHGDASRIRLPQRDVQVVALPIGIDAARFGAQATDPAVQAEAARLRATLAAKVLLIGVDRLDYTKGVIERLLAYERFLEQKAEWRGRVCLVQITVPSRFHVPEYRDMKRQIDETVGRIVGRFTHEGRTPLSYLYTALDHEQLSAYYRAADVALVTPLRDGMNLVAKEYVACHPEGDGTLILSEFAGAAHELHDALIVNPYDPDAILRQLELALAMAPEERADRMRKLHARVCSHDIRWWTTSFLDLIAGDRAAAPMAIAVG
jgi:trehalose 6-phosphate synthase/phosphatase